MDHMTHDIQFILKTWISKQAGAACHDSYIRIFKTTSTSPKWPQLSAPWARYRLIQEMEVRPENRHDRGLEIWQKNRMTTSRRTTSTTSLGVPRAINYKVQACTNQWLSGAHTVWFLIVFQAAWLKKGVHTSINYGVSNQQVYLCSVQHPRQECFKHVCPQLWVLLGNTAFPKQPSGQSSWNL